MEEGKDEELIQSSITSDPEHHMESDKNTRKHHTQEGQDRSLFIGHRQTVQTPIRSRFSMFVNRMFYLKEKHPTILNL